MPIFQNNDHNIDQIIRKTAEISETFSTNPYITYHRIVRIQSSRKYYVLSLLKIDKCVSQKAYIFSKKNGHDITFLQL